MSDTTDTHTNTESEPARRLADILSRTMARAHEAGVDEAAISSALLGASIEWALRSGHTAATAAGWLRAVADTLEGETPVSEAVRPATRH